MDVRREAQILRPRSIRMAFKDDVDRQIIEILKINARKKFSDIARQVNRSRTSVEKRVERLEADGVIKGYNVVLSIDDERSKRLRGFVIITHIKGAQCESLLEELLAFDIIKRKFSVYGEVDLVLEIEYTTLEEMMELKYYLLGHAKVESISISPIIKEWE